ncbi:MAG: hypothetical protein JWN86_2790 [Planctomycetota bacterium]|nr:hypothetical protein [Planctomycetota bacterium]
MRGWTLARFLAAIALLAVGFAAIRDASDTKASVALVLTYGLLVLASLAALISRFRDGASLGYAIVGWAVFLPIFVLAKADQPLPTAWAVERMVAGILPTPKPPTGVGLYRWGPAWGGQDSIENPIPDGMVSLGPNGMSGLGAVYNGIRPRRDPAFEQAIRAYNIQFGHAVFIGSCLVCFCFATLGAVIGQYLSQRERSETHRHGTPTVVGRPSPSIPEG